MLKKILSLILSFSLIYLPLPLSFSAPSTLSTDLEHAPSTPINHQEGSNQNLSFLQAIPKDPTTEFLGNSPLTSASGSENVLTLSGDPVLGGSGQHLSQAICSSFGDADCDYDIDQNDYLLWRSNFGKSAAQAGFADFNGNGTVDAADYTVWRKHLGGYVIDETPVLGINSKGGVSGFAQFLVDGDSVYFKYGGGAGGRGMNVAVLDPNTGLKLVKSVNFDTWADPSKFQAFMDFINALPDGVVILIGVGDDSGLRLNYATLAETTFQFLEANGSTKIRNIQTRSGWGMIFVKGGPVLGEVLSNPEVLATLTLELPDGYIAQPHTKPPYIEVLTNVPQFTNQNEFVIEYLSDFVLKQKTFTLHEGENHIEITEINDSHLATTIPFNITRDTVQPTGAPVISGVWQNYAGDIVVEFVTLAQDDVSGVSESRYSFDGGSTWSPWQQYFQYSSVKRSGSIGTTESVLVELRDAAGNIFRTSDTVSLPAPPRVYQVSVGDYYHQITIPTGSGEQLANVSFQDPTIIKVALSTPLTTNLYANPTLVRVIDSSGNDFPMYAGLNYSRDVISFVSSSPTIPTGQYTIWLSDEIVGRLTGTVDVHLDGDWNGPTGVNDPDSDRYPSGDGVPGGNFVFTFNLVNPSQGALLVQSSAVSAEPVLSESFRGQFKKYHSFFTPWQEKHFALPDLYRGKPDEKKSDVLDFINFYRLRYPEKTARILRWISFPPHLRS